MKERLAPLLENVAESTGACLFMMVQGNLLTLTLGHWLIASQTGIVAGALASLALFAARTDRRWVTALILGAITAVVDYFVHPGMFESAAVEAVLTGVGATLLSLVAGAVLGFVRSGRGSASVA